MLFRSVGRNYFSRGLFKYENSPVYVWNVGDVFSKQMVFWGDGSFCSAFPVNRDGADCACLSGWKNFSGKENLGQIENRKT